MKKIYLIVTLLFLFSAMTFGDVIGDTESMIPDGVNVFVKTRNISRLLKTANYLVYNLMDEEQRKGVLSEKDSFKDKTGVDYLDEESLKNFGVDTSRPVSFAMFDKDNMSEVMAVFIPVKNDKEFTAKFIEITKNMPVQEGGSPVNPVTAKHKNVEITQLRNDMYVAGLNGYFIIGSTGDIVRNIINVRDARNGSLVLMPEYKDYISRDKNNYDVNAFMTRKFLEQLNSTPKGETYGVSDLRDLVLTQGTEGNPQDLNPNSMISAIDYISAGMGLDGNKIQLNGSVKFAADNPYVEMLLGLLKTGENNRSLFVQNADTTVFLSLNYRYLDNLCKGGLPMCAQYNQFKSDLKNDGIDFEKEILPNYNGVVNAFAIDSGAAGGMGDLAVFLPINDVKKCEEIWKKFRGAAQAKYSKEKKFGEEKIDGKRAFWYIDPTQMRFFVAYDGRGIYAGNSTGLIKAALKSDTMDKAAGKGRLGTILNDKTFFLINIKKNNFLKNLLQMRAQGTPGLGAGLSRLGEMSLFCEKRDRLVSLDFDIEIKEGKKKGK